MKKRRKHIVLFVLIGVVVLLIGTLFMPFSFSGSNKESSYEYVMRDGLKDSNPNVTMIAMLGAHDAFSNEIGLTSKPNVNEGGIVNNAIVNTIAKGLVVRMSKAQKASCKELLYSGVRYLDTRLSYLDGKYYTIHGYVSTDFEQVVLDVIEFLETHPTEFIIMDIQHFYVESRNGYEVTDEEYANLFATMDRVQSTSGNSILDFVHYDSLTDNLESLTYDDATSNQTQGGVIFTIKNDSISYAYDRDGDESGKVSVRSLWHEDNGTNTMISAINEEADYINSKYDEMKYTFRVNQAQKTGFIISAKLVKSLFAFSLLDLANNFNKVLVSDEERFNDWLVSMPILMVDYSNSTKGDFNNKANKLIIEYNKNL